MKHKNKTRATKKLDPKPMLDVRNQRDGPENVTKKSNRLSIVTKTQSPYFKKVNPVKEQK